VNPSPSAQPPGMHSFAAASLGAMRGAPIDVPPPTLRFYWGSIALAFCAVVFAGVTVWAFPSSGRDSDRIAVAVIFGTLAAVLGAAATVTLVRRAARRCRVTLHDLGFAIVRRGRTQVVRYDEVESLSVREKTVLNNGVPAGLEQRFTFRGRFGVAKVEHFAVTGNLLRDFARDVIGQLATTASQRIGAAGALRGQGWRLDARAVHAGTTHVALPELSACAVMDGKVCLWKGDDEEPAIATPAASENAHVLLELASRAIDARGDAPGDRKPRAVPGIGRILFRRQPSTSLGVVAAFLALGLFGIPVFLLMDGLVTAAVICMALGLAFVVYVVYAFSHKLTFHEQGLTNRSLFHSRTVRYDDIARLTWAVTRRYVNGAYAGTTVRAKLVPASSKPMRISFSISGVDDALDFVRDQVSTRVADRMQLQLAKEGQVAWSPAAIFLRDSFELRPSKLIGKKEPRRLPYREGVTYAIHNGFCKLSPAGNDKDTVTIPCGAENFYPGMLLLHRLATADSP
jgi:hypothetical protein